eukprot:s6821_g2.t3
MMLLLMHGDGSGPADPKTRTGVPFSCHATGCYWISHERRLLQKSSSESVLAAVAGVPPVLEASSSASAAKSGERRKVLWKGPVSPLEVARKAVLYSTACSRVASHDFDVVRSFNPDADPRVQAMTSPLGRSAPWSVMGLATLLGMLCVDWVFDTGDSMQEAKVYYCALLPTLFSFPQCLRILIPVAFSGVHILMNLSGPPGARVAHLATCAASAGRASSQTTPIAGASIWWPALLLHLCSSCAVDVQRCGHGEANEHTAAGARGVVCHLPGKYRLGNGWPCREDKAERAGSAAHSFPLLLEKITAM